MENQWNDFNQGELDMKYEECKKAAFDYYKDNKNLNFLYYNTNDKQLQQKLLDWQQEFYEILVNEEKKNAKNENTNKEELEQAKNIQNNKTNKTSKSAYKNPVIGSSSLKSTIKSSSILDNKKHSFLIGNNINSQLQLAFGSKIKTEIEEEFLDLDEMVEMDFPKEYNPELFEILLKELGHLLNENRDSKMKGNDSKNRMKNDDFRLLLCLLRLKKAEMTEVKPYYSSHKFDLKDVYTTQIDPEEEETEDIEDFVRNYIEAEFQY